MGWKCADSEHVVYVAKPLHRLVRALRWLYGLAQVLWREWSAAWSQAKEAASSMDNVADKLQAVAGGVVNNWDPHWVWGTVGKARRYGLMGKWLRILCKELEHLGIGVSISRNTLRRFYEVKATHGGSHVTYRVSDRELEEAVDVEPLFREIARRLADTLRGNTSQAIGVASNDAGPGGVVEVNLAADIGAAIDRERDRIALGMFEPASRAPVPAPEPPTIPMVVELMKDLEQGGDADAEVNRIINARGVPADGSTITITDSGPMSWPASTF